MESKLLQHLQVIEDKLNDATPGPWYNFGDILKAEKALSPKNHVPRDWNIARFPMRTTDYPISHLEYESNKELIASCPTDIRRLIDACRVLLNALIKYQHLDRQYIDGQAFWAEKSLAAAEKVFEK